MKEDKDRWNTRFEQRPMTPPKPPGFIEDSIKQLAPGSVLDIASGDGAASLYLATQGFTVTAADISDIALNRLTTFSANQNTLISTITLDLDQSDATTQLGQFNNIVIAHFKPQPDYWPLFVELLHPGGKLLLTTFNTKHHEENGFSRRFCLEENELLDVNEQLIVEHHASVLRNGSYMDDYLFRRQ